MDKNYDHNKFEGEIYKLWEKSGAFTPKIKKSKKPFTIIMPPPNANDPLHIGHARFVAIEDTLIRYHRMKGSPTLWLPGSDHAGIETQYVFEKKLSKKGKSRFDYDNDTLYKMIWEYVEKNTGVMENQLKKLGASCDWTRFKFTLDSDIKGIVYSTFFDLYRDGLIYRGERIINYCPKCGTSFSQLEVNHIERKDKMYFLDYGIITIATTRPETIFADVAIAVNPKDKRYAKLIGKNATIPIINREIPIIADSLVDMEVGTGALKITPGHDSTDFEIGQKHKLTIISVIDDKGKMTGTPPKYIGKKALVARELVADDLKTSGKLKETKEITHTVGVCYKDNNLIEPTVSKQWFIKVESLTKTVLKNIKEKKITFPAKKYEKITIHWLKNLKDWNISRQIVWGLKIPAWRCDKCLEWTITKGKTPNKCSSCDNEKLTQDKDTFDTWFSSGQWPFATLKTTKEGDFEYFYPTTVMNTGYDILPFWVIRMMMLGLYVTKEPPFSKVLLHGLVRDKEGKKISKSKGNVIDPIEMVEKYGADALRMGLLWGSLVENDISLSEENIRAQRNFSNKLWNMARFLKMLLKDIEGKIPMFPDIPKNKLHEEDKKIIKKLSSTTKLVTKLLDKFRLNEALETLYQFVWNDLANDYLESTKSREDKEIAISTFRHVYINSLKLLHPFSPFVTEAIWREIKNLRLFPKELLISAPWPK